MTSTERSLIKKLAEVMAEVGNVPKRGRNTHFNYEFVQESDLVDAVRPALAKRNVMVFPDVLEESVRTVSGNKGDNYVTRIRVAFTFVDGDTGEERTFHIYADGQDNQDKGPYKALTGAVKYGLMKVFLIGTGDDPEHDRGHSQGSPSLRAQKSGDDPLEPLRARVRDLAEKIGANPDPILQSAKTADALKTTISNMEKAAQE